MPTFRWRPGSPPLSSPQSSAPAMRTTPAGCWPTSATSTGCWPSGRRSAGKPTPAAPRSIRTSPPTGSSSARCAGWLSMPCSPSCRSRRCAPGSLRRSPPTPPGLSPALRPTTCWYARLATATTSSRTGSAAPSAPRFLPAHSNARAQEVGMTRLDRPWHRPGAAWYALGRLPGLLHPPVSVYEPTAGSLSVLRDLPVVMRDGTTLRVNVVLPADAGRFPVLMSAHPYGKDNLPQRRGRGYRVSFLYRMLRQTALVRFSSLTGWEAPDPAWWAAQGYAVVNCDLRGAGTSEGSASLLSDQEGEDVYDLIEWAAGQPWSIGAVGMVGVSYLAISQWKAAALQPPSLKAICPWEGFTDAYRDLMRPGGIRETGFTRLWSLSLRRVRQRDKLTEQQRGHPLRDDSWRALVPDLEKITVPALICGSFSDNNLYGRGSIRGWEGIASTDRFLYTHRGGKWATFYSPEARAAQLRFFDRYLRRRDVPGPPRVRLEVRESRDVTASVREEDSWPLDRTEWRPLYLTAAGLVLGMDSHSGYRNNRADGPAALGRSERRRRHRPVRRGGEMARAHLCPLRGLLRIRPRPPHHRLAEGLPALPRPGQLTAVRARAHLGPPSAAGPRADRPGRHSPRPIRNPFPGRGDTAAGRRRTLALAAQPAHRAIPGRLPERP